MGKTTSKNRAFSSGQTSLSAKRDSITALLGETKELRKGERTRLRILETAMKLSHKHGPLGFTLQSVSEGSGLTQSGIYAYFKNITDVVIDMALYAAELGRIFIDDEMNDFQGTEAERIQKYFELNFEWIFKFRYQVHAVFVLYYLAASPTASKESEKAKKAFRVLNIASENRIRSLLDPAKKGQNEVYVQSLHSMLVGEMIKVLNNFYPKGPSAAEYAKKVYKNVAHS